MALSSTSMIFVMNYTYYIRDALKLLHVMELNYLCYTKERKYKSSNIIIYSPSIIHTSTSPTFTYQNEAPEFILQFTTLHYNLYIQGDSVRVCKN